MRILRIQRTAIVAVALLACTPLGAAESDVRRLLGDFDSGWRERWDAKYVKGDAAEPVVKVDGRGNRSLEFTSESAAYGLWRDLRVDGLETAKISWRWKTSNIIDSAASEREKKGDDYAARVFVVFDKSFLAWKTTAICYVWAGREPVGSQYPNPYAGRVHTIVLQSGGTTSGEWRLEERDLVADYVAAFGEEPEKIDAVALMVDTDNTGTRVVTCFDDLTVTLE